MTPRPARAEAVAAIVAQTPLTMTYDRAPRVAPKRPELTVDRAASDRLSAALDVVLAASDSISRAVDHFSKLAPDQAPPEAWVDRAAELHVALLAAWWALDDEAAVDAAAGGWTVGPPHAVGTPVERRLIRLRWETELMTPAKPALWWDRLVVAVKAAQIEAAVEAAGRALIAEGARRRYQHWHEHATREMANG